MLTVTGENEDISHGQQIGKDQKGDNQRGEKAYQSKNLGFIDDILIFADTKVGMQSCQMLCRNLRPGVECKSM